MHLYEHEFFLLPSERSAAARAHLETCFECRVRDDLAGEFDRRVPGLLRTQDELVASLQASDVIALARHRADDRAAEERRARRRRAIIGALTAIAAASAAAAVPAVRARIAALFAPVRATSDARPVPGTSEAAPADSGGSAGVAFVPGPSVTIRFGDLQRTGMIRIHVTSDAQVTIAHVGVAPAYAISSREVVVMNAASTASYSIGVPRTARHLAIHVAGRTVFSFDGGRITTIGASDGPGAYRLDFANLSREKP